MAMPDPNPASGMPIQFQKYWLSPQSGIEWGTDGDFMRCVKLINAKIEEHGGKPLPDHEIKGLCNILHRKATGAAPGHAAGESKPHMGKH
jgi:hypothetical protein